MKDDCPYQLGEQSVLRKFRGICEQVMSCRFIRNLESQEQSITIENLPDGSSRSRYPQYDKDDFLAFLTHYRKLVATKESTNIFSVLKTIGKYASDEERFTIKGIKQSLTREANHPPLRMAIGVPGNEKAFTPQQIENIIFNGQVFHSDSELQDDLRKLLDFDPITMMVFLRYATHVINNAWHVSCVLRERGHV